jgi:uncharacterized protein YbbK (DUF523 family)
MSRSPARDHPRVGVSACLLGERVRHDGGHKHEPTLLEAFAGQVEWVPVCPEIEVGMGVPREPILLMAAPDGVPSGTERARLVGADSGQDWTARMHDWARVRVVALAALNLSGFVLKSRSPSCGLRGVPIHGHVQGGAAGAGAGSQSPVSDRGRVVLTPTGRGLFAQALLDGMPRLPVEDEERLRDPSVRREFLVRVQTYDAGCSG